MKALICRIFGCAKPNSRVTAFSINGFKVWQCPRCHDIAMEEEK